MIRTGEGGRKVVLSPLVDAATIVVAADGKSDFYVTLASTTATRVLGNPTGLQDGQELTFYLAQDATGGAELTLDTDYIIANGEAFSNTKTANAVDILKGTYIASLSKVVCQVSRRFGKAGIVKTNAAPSVHKSTLSYDKTTRKVTITPTGANFDFWAGGNYFLITGAYTSGAHANTTGTYYYVFDKYGKEQIRTTFASVNFYEEAIFAIVYWNATSGDGIAFDERHNAERNIEAHIAQHLSVGTQASMADFIISGYTVGSNTQAGHSYATTSGTVYDEDNSVLLAAFADGGPYTFMYRSGVDGPWFWETAVGASQVPFYYGATPRIRYNRNVAGTWDLSEITNGGWVNYFVFGLPTFYGPQQVIVPGQTIFTSLAAAQLESVGSINWGTTGLPFPEIAPLYQISYYSRSSGAGGAVGGTYNTRLGAAPVRLAGTKQSVVSTTVTYVPASREIELDWVNNPGTMTPACGGRDALFKITCVDGESCNIAAPTGCTAGTRIFFRFIQAGGGAGSATINSWNGCFVWGGAAIPLQGGASKETVYDCVVVSITTSNVADKVVINGMQIT